MNKEAISVWEKTTSLPHFQQAKGELKTDVLIIGGGITGIVCGYFLKQAGIDCIIVEKNRICGGVTGNTTAKITAQHNFIYADLIHKEGREKAQMYLTANNNAVETYRKLSQAIDCNFEEKDSYVYTLNDRAKAEKEAAALQSLGISAELVENIPLPLKIAGAVKFPGQAQFHPLKFLSALLPGLTIYENTWIRDIQNMTAISDQAKIQAKTIIVATHFPILNRHGSYFIKMYQHRSYVISGENAPNVNGMYIDCEENGLSFRNEENLLFIGGGDHKTGKRGGGWRELRNFAKTNYPEWKETAHWATQDCMTLDKIPYIGQYSKNTPGLYVATGFNKWGMSSSMAAATILCDMIQGKPNELAKIFSPSRSILKPQLFINAASAATGLLTPSGKRCTHMGCALKWNEKERTWDCPCHGSRFQENGEVVENPANKNQK